MERVEWEKETHPSTTSKLQTQIFLHIESLNKQGIECFSFLFIIWEFHIGIECLDQILPHLLPLSLPTSCPLFSPLSPFSAARMCKMPSSRAWATYQKQRPWSKLKPSLTSCNRLPIGSSARGRWAFIRPQITHSEDFWLVWSCTGLGHRVPIIMSSCVQQPHHVQKHLPPRPLVLKIFPPTCPAIISGPLVEGVWDRCPIEGWAFHSLSIFPQWTVDRIVKALRIRYLYTYTKFRENHIRTETE